MMRWRSYIKNDPWDDSAVLMLIRDDLRSPPALVTSLTFEALTDGGLIPVDKAIRMERGEMQAFLQAVVDAAWGMGVRPSGMDENKGKLEATERHLADMQRLVFDRLTKAT